MINLLCGKKVFVSPPISRRYFNVVSCPAPLSGPQADKWTEKKKTNFDVTLHQNYVCKAKLHHAWQESGGSLSKHCIERLL